MVESHVRRIWPTVFGRFDDTYFADYLASHYSPVGPVFANKEYGWNAVVWKRMTDEIESRQTRNKVTHRRLNTAAGPIHWLDTEYHYGLIPQGGVC
jgi:hypothetical protein